MAALTSPALAGLANNIFAPAIYFTNYMFGKDPINTNKRYGYFAGDGGGFYVSNDEGRNWSLLNPVVSGYKNTGTLCIHPTIPNLFFVAISYTGLYKTTDGGNTWNNIPGWVTADQVDSKGNIIVAFGKRTGDQYEKIYTSTNSGTTWAELTNQSHRLPNTTSLVINPYNNNQLWIGTAGDGIFVFDGLTIGIKRISTEVPGKFTLYQNYPNPFNPTTKIKFDLPGANANVRIIIYDVLGKEVTSIVNQKFQSGTYEITWDGSKYSSGLYFYKITINDGESEFYETRKMLLLK